LFIGTICGLLFLIVLSFSAIVKKYSLKSWDILYWSSITQSSSFIVYISFSTLFLPENKDEKIFYSCTNMAGYSKSSLNDVLEWWHVIFWTHTLKWSCAQSICECVNLKFCFLVVPLLVGSMTNLVY
jgi:hypothetical protein